MLIYFVRSLMFNAYVLTDLCTVIRRFISECSFCLTLRLLAGSLLLFLHPSSRGKMPQVKPVAFFTSPVTDCDALFYIDYQPPVSLEFLDDFLAKCLPFLFPIVRKRDSRNLLDKNICVDFYQCMKFLC